jgi:hypothetical protein
MIEFAILIRRAQDFDWMADITNCGKKNFPVSGQRQSFPNPGISLTR